MLTCFACARPHDAAAPTKVCDACGMPLRVDLDLPPGAPEERIRREDASLWRYADLLPVPRARAVTLGEGWTPVVGVGDDVWIKDESRNPTGSFKARGMSLAVSAAVERGAQRLVAPSAGNAAGALAAYGAHAGVPVAVAMPADTPRAFVDECHHYGAQVHLVDGTIADAGRFLAERRGPADVDVSTMREPYRVEGKKTMGYELFEQFDGDLPDVVVYPTGGGTGLVGMWKAWNELERLGWIGSARPRLVVVQAAGCAPIVRAHDRGADGTEPWLQPATAAFGLRVPSPIGGFLCLRAIAGTAGTAVAVAEERIHHAAAALAAHSGLDICPEGGAAWAAVAQLRADDWIRPGERTVVFNTGTGLKYR
ncbi:MAG: threonine synthase [Actinobacteria bacterium]|nr:threonine synthase [Actinomycetota bacterium]